MHNPLQVRWAPPIRRDGPKRPPAPAIDQKRATLSSLPLCHPPRLPRRTDPSLPSVWSAAAAKPIWHDGSTSPSIQVVRSTRFLGLGFCLCARYRSVKLEFFGICAWLGLDGLWLCTYTYEDPTFGGLVVGCEKLCRVHRLEPVKCIAFEGINTCRCFYMCYVENVSYFSAFWNRIELLLIVALFLAQYNTLWS
jgi:hypothetical protein